MKPSKLYEALHALIGERVPLHIWRPCGVGKSQIFGQVARDLDYNFLDVRAVQLDPVDLRGLPRIASDQTEWVPPKFLPTTGKGILFLDELTSAPQITQAGCYQLVLDRRLGNMYCRTDGWSSQQGIRLPSGESIFRCRDHCGIGSFTSSLRPT
jgi:MoxR-like ATPase